MAPAARNRIGRVLAATSLALAAALAGATPALACSPPFNPTIEALGPDQAVLVGWTGDPAPGGRLFHVERVYNGDISTTPIVIAFQEGEPVGDCSYPVSAGWHLIIAPYRLDDGRLAADLGTLQAGVETDDGRHYQQEATRLFGPGITPVVEVPLVAGEDEQPFPLWAAVLVAIGVGAAVLLLAAVLARRPGR